MLNESIISPNETRSRSGPPSRLAATQEPDRNAVLKPAPAVSLAVRPSHTAGITMKPGSASSLRRRSGAFMDGIPPDWTFVRDDRTPSGFGRAKGGFVAKLARQRPQPRELRACVDAQTKAREPLCDKGRDVGLGETTQQQKWRSRIHRGVDRGQCAHDL